MKDNRSDETKLTQNENRISSVYHYKSFCFCKMKSADGDFYIIIKDGYQYAPNDNFSPISIKEVKTFINNIFQNKGEAHRKNCFLYESNI